MCIVSYQDVYDIYNVYLLVQKYEKYDFIINSTKTMLAPVDLIMQRMNYMPDAFSINVFRIYGIYKLKFYYNT